MSFIDPRLSADALLASHAQRLEGIKAEGAHNGAGETDGLKEFDAYFLAQVLKGAQSSNEEHILDGGSAGRMYRDYFYEEIGRVLSEKGGLGLTEQLQDSLVKSSPASPGSENSDVNRENGK